MNMKIVDQEIEFNLKEEFTEIVPIIKNMIKDEKLENANLYIFVPHEVSSIVPIGWEDGLIDDAKDFLKNTVPEGKYKNHDEPGTPWRYNFFEHMRAKVAGQNSITLLVKDGELYIGKYQNYYFYSPVWKTIPDQKMLVRIEKFE